MDRKLERRERQRVRRRARASSWKLRWESELEMLVDLDSGSELNTTMSEEDYLLRPRGALRPRKWLSLLERGQGQPTGWCEEESSRQSETSPDAAQSNTTVLPEDDKEQLSQLKWKMCACYRHAPLYYRSDDSLDLLPRPWFECELEPEVELTLEEKALLLEVSLEEIAPQQQSRSRSQSEPEPEPEPEPESESESEPESGSELEQESESESEPESEPELEQEPELTFSEKKWQALHLFFCKQLADLDPKRNALVPTRFHCFNIAFFDLDEESEAIHGPPLKELPFSKLGKTGGSSVNVVSLKVIKSDVNYPIRVFGTVLARDVIDYKCVYLFRRERDDPQLINSPEDELTLTGPRRAFVVPDSMFFEINLKIKGASGVAEGDFSKGVVEYSTICCDDSAMALRLTSWRSTVELVCTPVLYPVEATLEVKILEGPRDVPLSGKVIAWTDGYEDNPITLYEYDDSKEAGTRGLMRDDGSVALARNLVAVPIDFPGTVDEDLEIVLNVCFVDSHDENKRTMVALQYPCEEELCRHGSYELQLKVAWTAMLYRPMSREIQNRWFSLPLPLQTYKSWMWELVFYGSRGCASLLLPSRVFS